MALENWGDITKSTVSDLLAAGIKGYTETQAQKTIAAQNAQLALLNTNKDAQDAAAAHDSTGELISNKTALIVGVGVVALVGLFLVLR